MACKNKKLKKQLMIAAKKKGLNKEQTNAYVYGTLNKINKK